MQSSFFHHVLQFLSSLSLLVHLFTSTLHPDTIQHIHVWIQLQYESSSEAKSINQKWLKQKNGKKPTTHHKWYHYTRLNFTGNDVLRPTCILIPPTPELSSPCVAHLYFSFNSKLLTGTKRVILTKLLFTAYIMLGGEAESCLNPEPHFNLIEACHQIYGWCSQCLLRTVGAAMWEEWQQKEKTGTYFLLLFSSECKKLNLTVVWWWGCKIYFKERGGKKMREEGAGFLLLSYHPC